MTRRRRGALVLALTFGALGLALAGPAQGQLLDNPGSTTTTAPESTTTAPSTSTTTTAPSSSTTTTTQAPLLGGPSSTTTTTTTTTTTPAETGGNETVDPGPESTPAPEGAEPDEGAPDGDTEITWGYVPPEAQAIIDSVQRSAPNSSQALYEAVQELVALGLSEGEAIRVGFGRFPVAGVANYSHDWLYPRYGPGFRFHHGTDVFAAFGTPLRAPVDGTVTSTISALGGLSVKVHMDDGTYFYMAHLSALPEGFVDGMSVKTGDIVGFIGDSGNAKGGAPHLHLGIYVKGGGPVDPKPVLDRMLADAMESLPSVIAQVKANRPVAPGSEVALPTQRIPRALLATALLRPVVDDRAAGGATTAMLFEAVGNPSSGGLAVASQHAQELAAGIDWDARVAEAEIRRRIVEQTAAVLDFALAPLNLGSS